MDSKIPLFAVLFLSVIFVLVSPAETTTAQDTESKSDDKDQDGSHHKGKSCTSKEKQFSKTSDI